MARFVQRGSDSREALVVVAGVALVLYVVVVVVIVVVRVVATFPA